MEPVTNLYDRDKKAHTGGSVTVTSHRILWMGPVRMCCAPYVSHMCHIHVTYVDICDSAALRACALRAARRGAFPARCAPD
jgi:hypothetical protein